MSQDYSPNEEILEACITAIYDEGKSIEDCLAQFPEEQEQLEPMLRLASMLQGSRKLEAPTDFRMQARSQLDLKIAWLPQDVIASRNGSNGKIPLTAGPAVQKVSAAEVLAAASAPRGAMPRAARLPSVVPYVAGLVVILLLLAVSTTVNAANRTLPGEPLYPMKIAMENVQLLLAPSDAADANLHAQFADQRLAELKQVVEQEKTDHIKEAHLHYAEELAALQMYIESNDLSAEQKSELAEKLAPALANHDRELETMAAAWPDDAEDWEEVVVVLGALYDAVVEHAPDWPVHAIETLVPTLEALPTHISSAIAPMTRTPMPFHTPTPHDGYSGTATPWPTWILTDWPETWPTDGWEEGEKVHTLPPEAWTAVATIIPEVLTVIPDVQTAVPIIETLIPEVPDPEDFEDWFEGWEDWDDDNDDDGGGGGSGWGWGP